MNNALGRGTVELGDGNTEIGFGLLQLAGSGCLADLADFSLQLAFHCSIAGAPLQALTMTLGGTWNVGHDVRVQVSGFRTFSPGEPPQAIRCGKVSWRTRQDSDSAELPLLRSEASLSSRSETSR